MGRARFNLRRLQSAVRSRLGLPTPWVSGVLLGRHLWVREGVLRSTPDYDDAWLLACAQHAELVFDVGANVGQASLLFLMVKTVMRVVLVDPNTEALTQAADNLIRNHLSARAAFVPSFVGEADDAKVELWTVGTGSAGSMYKGHAQTAARAGAVQTVPTVTLDRLAEQYGVPDLVKIDVEGAEHVVLLGGRKCVANQKTRFLVEMHALPELPMLKNAQLVLDWCRANRYAAWYLAEGTRLDDAEHIKHRGRCHLLLQPESWSYPAWIAGIKQSAPLEAATAMT